MTNYQTKAIMQDRNMNVTLAVEASNEKEAEQTTLNYLSTVGGYYGDGANLVRIEVLDLDAIERYDELHGVRA